MNLKLYPRPGFTVAAALAAFVAMGSGAAMATCANGVLPADCEVKGFFQAITIQPPTGISLDENKVYTFTVQNPTTTWSHDAGATQSTANGVSPHPNGIPQLSFGGLTANQAALVANIDGTYIPIATGGAVISSQGGPLNFLMWDSTNGNNSGKQNVVVAEATDPTLIAGVTVFAKENSLNALHRPNSSPSNTATSFVYSGEILDPTRRYYIHPTDPNQKWSIGPDANRTSTAGGLDPATLVFSHNDGGNPVFVPAGICEEPAFNFCEPVDGNSFGDPVNGFRFNELVALINGKYYAIGNGRTITGLGGELFLGNWDNDQNDNFGFINVSIHLLDVPEPASLALFSLGLAGLAWARQRRRRVG